MKELTKESFMEKASAFYDKLRLEMDDSKQDFYAYEEKLDELMTQFGKEVLQEGLGSVPDDKRKKKIQTRFGKIEISEKHSYSLSVNGYRVSPYLQERVVIAGQSEVYSLCTELINKFLRIELNDMQIHRVTNTYGELSEGLIGEAESLSFKQELKKEDIVYVQTDGSMILTREDKWQEVKLGRIFRQSDVLELSNKRQEISGSLYAAHIGAYGDFLKKFEPLVDIFDSLDSKLVFITDGASWIRLWQSENYPNALQILDFTHGTDHISDWLEFVEKDKKKRQQEFNIYKTLLLETGIEAVIKRIEQTPVSLKTVEEERRKLLNYLNTNAYRMNYPDYLKQDLCIGSGAIEAAHRTIIQKRMKQSGQRWSEKRVQNMLNLKVANASGHWDKVVSIIRNSAMAA